jgi:hypothetical protein
MEQPVDQRFRTIVGLRRSVRLFDPPIQKQTSTNPRLATVRPPPTTSARWGIASSRWVAGKFKCSRLRGWHSRFTVSQLPDDVFRPAIGAQRERPNAEIAALPARVVFLVRFWEMVAAREAASQGQILVPH